MKIIEDYGDPYDTVKPIIPKKIPGAVLPEYPPDCECFPNTEFESKYVEPKRFKKPITREARMAQFWWHEFYEEYLKGLQRGIKPHPMPKTTYKEEFGRGGLQSNSDDRTQEIIDKYPVYGSRAITLWNKTGDKTCTHRRKYSITRPMEECDKQFC